MVIIITLITGLIIGVVADKIMNTNHSTVWTIVLGIAGSSFGKFLFGMLGFHTTGFASFVVSVIGACLLIVIANKIAG